MSLKKIKIAGLIMATVLCFGLAGCGSKEKENEKDTVEETKAPEETAEETPEEVEETPEETEEPEVVGFQPGVLTDTGYVSEWLKLEYIAPEGVVMSTKEEIDAVIAQNAEQLSQTLDAAAVEAATSATSYEMIATTADGASKVMLLSEPSNGLDVNGYIETLSAQLTQTGMIVPGEEAQVGETEELAGITFTGFVAVSADAATTQLYMIGLKDDRIVTMIFTAPTESISTEMIKLMMGFSEL